MCNDHYIDDEERPDEEQIAQMEAEYHYWKLSLEHAMHYDEMCAAADMRRKEIRENQP